MGNFAATESARVWRNWKAERDSAALYEAFARFDGDPRQQRVYRELAGSELRHAAFWEARLREAGEHIPEFHTSLRTRTLIQLARHLGVGFVLPSVIAREMRDRDDYEEQQDARAAGLVQEEHGHAAALRGGAGAGGIGNNLRAAVLGANDGLASNFCLMMGVAGAGATPTMIVLAGAAGLLSGAGSMALGEWLSVTNARELALSQLDRQIGERRPDAGDASVISAGNATSAAVVSFLLFAVGALVPLLPFLVLRASLGIAGSIALTTAALFVLGIATSLFNGRSALFSGLRQVAIGVGAAAVIYLAGHAMGGLAAP
jgi:vacuolar iron transporter family protein